MTDIRSPKSFIKMCKELRIDPAILVDIGLSIEQWAARETRQSEVPEMNRVIEDFLTAGWSPEEYFDWWDTLSVGFHFNEPDGVVDFLRKLQIELQVPRILP